MVTIVPGRPVRLGGIQPVVLPSQLYPVEVSELPQPDGPAKCSCLCKTNSRSSIIARAGSSTCGPWPHSSNTASRANPGRIKSIIICANSNGHRGSFAPATTSVGQAIRSSNGRKSNRLPSPSKKWVETALLMIQRKTQIGIARFRIVQRETGCAERRRVLGCAIGKIRRRDRAHLGTTNLLECVQHRRIVQHRGGAVKHKLRGMIRMTRCVGLRNEAAE